MKNNFVIQLNRKKEEAFVTVIINNNYDKQIDSSKLTYQEKMKLAYDNNYMIKTNKKDGSFYITVKTRILFLIDNEMYEEEFKDLSFKQLDNKMSYINVVQFFNFNSLEKSENFKSPNFKYVNEVTFKDELSSYLYDYYKSLNYCFVEVDEFKISD